MDATRSEAERRAREEREYWDGWYRLLTCGTAPNPRDAERGRGAGAGVAGYADSDDDDDDDDATGRHTGGRCRLHGLGLGCAISCCCLEPNRRSRSFQDLRESVSPGDFAQDFPEAIAVAPDPPRSFREDQTTTTSAVAAAADAFETAADAGDAIAAADALRAITQAARTPGARDAVPVAATRAIAAESSESSEGSDSRALPGTSPTSFAR